MINPKPFVLPSLLALGAFTALIAISVLGAQNMPIETLNIVSSAQDEKETVMIFGGDVMLGRSVLTHTEKVGDWDYPFRKIVDTLKDADLTFVNLENPIIENCPRHNEGYIFCAPPEILSGMVKSGVDLVSLENNHTRNYGDKGFAETKKHLYKNAIGFVTSDSLVVKEINGTRFGFIAFNKFGQQAPTLSVSELAKLLKANAIVEVLIVSVHWGEEYQGTALPGVQRFGHMLVDLGADLVIGHHPHWVQNIDTYKGKKIYFSLGNLVFDQMESEETKAGLLIKLTFREGEVVDEKLINTYMANWAQPEVVEQRSRQ